MIQVPPLLEGSKLCGCINTKHKKSYGAKILNILIINLEECFDKVWLKSEGDMKKLF